MDDHSNGWACASDVSDFAGHVHSLSLDLVYANISTFKDHVDPTYLGVSYYHAVPEMSGWIWALVLGNPPTRGIA